MTTQAKNHFAITDWGLLSYAISTERQLALVERRIAAQAPDTLIFVEHPAVYTIGARSGAQSHLVASADFLKQHAIEVSASSRGGDITLHSPGQLVVYPIIKLEHKDLHQYLRDLEEVIIRTVGFCGLATGRAEGKTGVWVDGKRKVAAIGVAVRQWVTYHGVAINLNNNLELYNGIIPCGLANSQVTSLAKELREASPTMEELKKAFVTAWSEVLGGQPLG